MNFSKTIRNLSVLALLLVTVFFAFYSVGVGNLGASTNAPVGLSGTIVILQADGGAPPPPPPPPSPKPNQSSASLA
jgi:hypothetical protein